MAEKAEGTIEANGKTYDHIAMNYLLIGKENADSQEKKLVNVELSINDEGLTRSYTSVPVQRNYRTNIVGNILTSPAQFNVVILPGFAEDVHPFTPEDELAMAAQTSGEFTLEADLVLTSALNVTGTLTINMGNHKLTGSINVAENANLTINNGTIENTDDNTSGIVSNGTLTLNNVEVISARHALRIESGKAVINGGTYKVAPISSKTLNALNVGDDNTVAEVLIKGGTFIGPKGTMADSGAAVSVKAGSKVTVEGGDFSGGKNNTLSCKGEISITGGTFDQNPSAWVAEGYKAIESDGKYFVVAEGYDAFIVVTPENIGSTTFNADNALYWFEGAFNNVDFKTAAGKTQTYDASAATFNGRIKINVARTADGYFDVETERSGNYKLVGFATENSLCVAANAVESLVIEGCTAYMAYLNITNTSTTLQGNTFVRPATAEDEYQRFDNGRYQEDIIQVYAENYDLQLVGNTIKNEKVVAKCNCIAIMGEYEQYQQGHNPQWTNSLTMTGNTISDVSNTEALVKIWNDVTFAPVAWPADYEITAAALALAKQIKVENTVNGGSCVLDIQCRRATGPDANIKLYGTDEDLQYAGKTVADNAGLQSALDAAEQGSVIRLVEGVNYGTITAGELKDVEIVGKEGSVMRIITNADTKIENVTLKNVNFAYNSTSGDCIVMNGNAQVDNLVLEGCTFTGIGKKEGHGLANPNNNASIAFKKCVFKDLGYPIWAFGGYKVLTIEECTFENIFSWAIMPQSGFDGDLTITGCNFTKCISGLVKAGTLTAGHTFTFTNNTITDCKGHDGKDSRWFEFNASAGTSVISGNKKDGADWTPGSAEGLN